MTGHARMWHPLTFDFVGPRAQQGDSAPNPFLDYRLQVTFAAPNGRKAVVPGFFDGDGQGRPSGTTWRVRFTPDREGTWTYTASFRQGPGVAVSLDAQAGQPASFDGATGEFSVRHRGGAIGLLGLGRLEHAGHYFKLTDGGHWIKGGTDDPENFLAYAGFRGTSAGKFGLHRYAAHERDFRPGDPDWGGGRGRGIIGALNYLAEQKVNSIYFLPMNVGGDGQDTWPYAGAVKGGGDPANDNVHFDVGKLHEWEIVFGHAQRKGIALHFVLNEAEAANKRELDDAELGVERKLFYREMVARFGHHNGVFWNLCEEYNLKPNLGAARVKAFAAYVAAQDPYDHPIGVHNGHPTVASFEPFFGDPNISFLSVQHTPGDAQHKFGPELYGELVETLRARSRAAGRPLVIGIDEADRLGKIDDESRAPKWPHTSGASRLRKAVLWPTLLSGGQIEYILETLLETEDFRPYEAMWRYTRHARRFVEENLPFWDMEPDDKVVSDAADAHEGVQVLAKKGEVYAIYLPSATRSAGLDLRASVGRFAKRWYDPRAGEFVGRPEIVEGGLTVRLGAPPRDPEQDWAVLVRREPDRLRAVPSRCAGGTVPVFTDKDGPIVVDLETLPLPGDGAWVAERDRAVGTGFSGPGYIRSTVEAGTPGPGRIGIRVNLATPGAWTLSLRGRHDHPRADTENDAFLRIDDGPWLKYWVGKPVGSWSWSSSAHGLETDHNHKTPIAGELKAGTHVIWLAARSPNFKLDRLVLARDPAGAEAARAPAAKATTAVTCMSAPAP
jgi:hypothetical protein